jgi:ferredoxin
MHHQLFNGNYALYFTWWDKWMGTQFNDYEARHEQLFERKNISSTPLIHTNPNEAQTTQKATITVNIQQQVYHFETNSPQTILQSGLAQNIPMPFSCQKGLCGTCKMKCIEGQVTMKRNQALGELELKAGYILTCQSLPLTDNVVLQKE